MLKTLRWVRTFGDLVFIVGALSIAWQVVNGLLQRSSQLSLQDEERAFATERN